MHKGYRGICSEYTADSLLLLPLHAFPLLYASPLWAAVPLGIPAWPWSIFSSSDLHVPSFSIFFFPIPSSSFPAVFSALSYICFHRGATSFAGSLTCVLWWVCYGTVLKQMCLAWSSPWHLLTEAAPAAPTHNQHFDIYTQYVRL